MNGILKALVILSGIFFVFAAPSALAVTVSPVLFDENMDPEDVMTGVIKLINETNQTQTYYVSAQNFVASGEDGQQQYIEEREPTDLASWITYDRQSLTLKPAEISELRWVVKVPKDAEPGGHYSAIFFSTQPNDRPGGVGVGGKAGVLFLVNVSGNIKEGANIVSFKVSGLAENGKPSKVINYLPALFELRLRNTGSVHFKPEGDIVIKNIFGGTTAVVPANAAGGKSLPNSIRKLKAEWGPKDAEKATGFVSGLKAELKGFALGRYVARADLVYGKQAQHVAATVVFWVFPWRLILLAFLALVIFFFLLKGYNRLVIRSAMSKAKQEKTEKTETSSENKPKV